MNNFIITNPTIQEKKNKISKNINYQTFNEDKISNLNDFITIKTFKFVTKIFRKINLS
jgi:hypothetical protein